MEVLNYTNLRANLKKVLDTVIDDQDTVIINRGDNSVVMISLAEYNSWKETMYLLSTKKNRERLEEAIARDQHKEYINRKLID
jgi:antitoxin YefM